MSSRVQDSLLLDQARADLVERLRSRRPELGDTVTAHVRSAVADSTGQMDAEFAVGLAQVAAACVECGLMAIAQGEEWLDPVPPVVVMQARRAVRNGVSLATVLCRYTAGYTLAWDVVLEEAGCSDIPDRQKIMLLRQAWIGVMSLLTRLVAEVTNAYICELNHGEQTHEQRRAELVRRLLAGELGSVTELDYDLDAEHIGLVAFGTDAQKAIEVLAEHLGRKLLLVSHDDGTVWAWLGGRSGCATADIERYVPEESFRDMTLVIGEPECGITGFRGTHRSAQLAFRVAQNKPQRITRYADVTLEAHARADDMLACSLVAAYLAPLDLDRDGASLRTTLRAFYDAGRNESKAARVLGIGRQTVIRHLRRVEELIGRPLHTCHAEIEVALRL